MKLDIEKIKNQIGCSAEEFAMEMQISMTELQSYCNGEPMSGELLSNMCKFTGLGPFSGSIYITENETKTDFKAITPDNTFELSQTTRKNLIEYVKQGLNEIEDETVHNEISKIYNCVKKLRKPRISFSGKSDTGKSTLINSLLGAERMPAKWTPTTSIVVYIKHIDDRPSFMKEDVWIFGKKSNELWNDIYLDDEGYCRKFLIEKGDFSLLSTFGTHQHEENGKKIATSAVAFIDSPLLKNCDILDLPGFGATSEDDALQKFNTQDNVTDILLYLSRSNGFLENGDIDYLRECIKSLRPVEQKGKNNIKKLENLFVIASQAGAVSNGNSTELKEILDIKCKALCSTYANSSERCENLLPIRTKLTGYVYNEEDFRARFFTYEKDMTRLCKQFNNAFISITENLPIAMYNEFAENLKVIVSDSIDIIKKCAYGWESVLENQSKYLELLREIKDKEPARKIEQKSKNDEIYTFITSSCIGTQQDIESMYTSMMNEDNLISLIDKYDVKNQKESKQNFASTVNDILSKKIQKIITNKTDLYTQKIDDYLHEYSQTFSDYSTGKNIIINFDSTNSFALGLTKLTALGASMAWLATSFPAMSLFTFGSLAGWSSVISIGGIIGIAISAFIASVVFLVNAMTWKKDLANKIIKAYTKNDYLEKIFDDVDKYWNDTRSSFKIASQRVEDDWTKQIEEYESLADEKNIPKIQKKIAEIYKGLAFLNKLPSSKSE